MRMKLKEQGPARGANAVNAGPRTRMVGELIHYLLEAELRDEDHGACGGLDMEGDIRRKANGCCLISQ